MDILAKKLTLILTDLINIGFWKIEAFKSYLIATKIEKGVDSVRKWSLLGELSIFWG